MEEKKNRDNTFVKKGDKKCLVMTYGFFSLSVSASADRMPVIFLRDITLKVFCKSLP